MSVRGGVSKGSVCKGGYVYEIFFLVTMVCKGGGYVYVTFSFVAMVCKGRGGEGAAKPRT